ncbi:MAG: serine/threonine-protein kinase [Planctomycetota bacterium]|nr:serine/threonine-protein kinase [Planctomycetota bacterium]
MENTQVGPFLILKRLGSNRRQQVFQALQTEQNKEVALKFISIPPTVDWNQAVNKIHLEVRVLQKFRHPNLVRLYGAGVEGDKIFLAHKLIKGESLTTILARRGRLAPDLVVEIGRQVAELLQYLHEQEAMHGKLTPDKILIDEKNRVKVADLRLNRSRRKRWDDGKKRELDIAAYMAPEQFSEGATSKSDIYALGVILFEMLTGKLPYEPDTMGRMNRRKMEQAVPSVSQHVMNCPIWLERITCQMLSPLPRKRPHSARAVVLAFEEIKNIDTNRRASVMQVSGNFNPLTAGVDKTEADRLLGKKPKSRQIDERPFYERIPFLAGSFLLLIGIICFTLLPTSSVKLYQQAESMMNSADSSEWRRARSNLRTILDRGPDDAYHQEASDLYYESRRRTLVEQIEKGTVLWTQSPNTRKLAKAIKLQSQGQLDDAEIELQLLLKSVDPAGEEQHIATEARIRLLEISEARKLPTEIESLEKLIEKLLLANTADQNAKAVRRLTEIVNTFSGDKKYAEVIAMAKQARQQLEEQTKSIAPVGEPDDKANSTAQDNEPGS